VLPHLLPQNVTELLTDYTVTFQTTEIFTVTIGITSYDFDVHYSASYLGGMYLKGQPSVFHQRSHHHLQLLVNSAPLFLYSLPANIKQEIIMVVISCKIITQFHDMRDGK
jgi:hypothetical protein